MGKGVEREAQILRQADVSTIHDLSLVT